MTRYLSVCSGIEAASVAWESLGWQPAAFSEIEKFPRAVLAHHYPNVPCHADFTTISGDEYGPVDLLVGGTPCQSFSVAGLRGGLDDDRGNLALEFCRLAQRIRPRWIVWENVPGVLSSNGGRDFGSILGAMGELGYGWAYRILDAQFFGVPQRRRRIFLVGHLGDYRRAAAVLFERHCLRGYPAPRREKRQTAPTIPARSSAGGGLGTDFDCDGGVIAFGWQASIRQAQALSDTTAPTLDRSKTPAVAQCLTTGTGQRYDPETETLVPVGVKYAYYSHDYAHDRITDPSGVNPALTKEAHASGNLNIATGHTVRRLTPTECERLQGFPDNWTRIPWRGKPLEECPDGPRYKAIGNSMAVPVMRWIGQRITAVEAIG